MPNITEFIIEHNITSHNHSESGESRKKNKTFVPIDVLRSMVMEKLQHKEYRVKFTNSEVKRINSLLNNFRPQSYENYLGVIAQIEKDIKLGYLKYDALAMWLSPDGLAKYEPTLIRNIARECGL